MMQCGDGTRLGAMPHSFGVISEHLDRDRAVEQLVLGAEDVSRAAARDSFADPVTAGQDCARADVCHRA